MHNNNFILIDSAREVRKEDSLDLKTVDEYIKSVLPDLKGNLSIKQYTGGASNLTYELSYANKKLILRKPPKGVVVKSAHDMGREYSVMESLKPYYPTVPKVISFCNDSRIIGSDFFIMEKIEGIIPRANFPKGLLKNEQETKILCTNVLDKLIELHSIDIKTSGLDKFGKGVGYCSRQIEGWSERYRKAKTWNTPTFTCVMDWLKSNIPKTEKLCFIHNDFRFDNVVLDPQNPTRVIGILDWEMATVGDPLMDLGNSLAYWVQENDHFFYKMFRRQPTHVPGMLSRNQVIEYYQKNTGITFENFIFYEIYGLFRLAVIIQQIYFRYYHKKTNNRAFKNFWMASNYLFFRCKRRIKEEMAKS